MRAVYPGRAQYERLWQRGLFTCSLALSVHTQWCRPILFRVGTRLLPSSKSVDPPQTTTRGDTAAASARRIAIDRDVLRFTSARSTQYRRWSITGQDDGFRRGYTFRLRQIQFGTPWLIAMCVSCARYL
jgi:hypothetical protein